MNLILAIILIVAALILGIVIGVIFSIGRYAKNVFPAGEILIDWTAIDPSNISIRNGKDILHWHEKKRLMFDVVNTKYKPGMEK